MGADVQGSRQALPYHDALHRLAFIRTQMHNVSSAFIIECPQVGIAPEQIDLEKDVESLPHVQLTTRFFPASKASLWDEKHECYVVIEGGITQAHEVKSI